MSATFDAAWLILVLLAAARVAGVLAFTPVLGMATLPGNIRIYVILAISVLVSGFAASASPESMPQTLVGLVLAMLRELLLGAVLGFGILTAFGALAVGGRLLDYQMGFGIATLIDPSTRNQGSLMGAMLAMLGGVLFLSLDAHHTLLRGLAFAFRTVPVGVPHELPVNLVVEQFGLMFVYGFILVAPAVTALLLMDLVVGFAARVMPQVNAYFVSLPAKTFAGLLITAISLRFSGNLVQGMYERVFTYWQKALVAQ